MKIVILRDPRESVKKCSLTPLKTRTDVEFLPYQKTKVHELGRVIFLDHTGPALGPADRSLPLLVLDSSWRHLPELRSKVTGELIPRSIPSGFVTAYPRKSKVFEDPSSGLASIEALFIATLVLGEPDLSLLKDYYWKEDFLRLNREKLLAFGSGLLELEVKRDLQ